MSTGWENGRVAARIRGILNGKGDLACVAAYLGVHETALRMSIDEAAPYPTMDVILAVVREYDVDPNWLLTGQSAANGECGSLEASRDELLGAVERLVDESRPVKTRYVRGD